MYVFLRVWVCVCSSSRSRWVCGRSLPLSSTHAESERAINTSIIEKMNLCSVVVFFSSVKEVCNFLVAPPTVSFPSRHKVIRIHATYSADNVSVNTERTVRASGSGCVFFFFFKRKCLNLIN